MRKRLGKLYRLHIAAFPALLMGLGIYLGFASDPWDARFWAWVGGADFVIGFTALTAQIARWRERKRA